MQTRIFDFDGTLTDRDTFFRFLRHGANPLHSVLLTLAFPLASVLHATRLVSNFRFKAALIFLRFLGCPPHQWQVHCLSFAPDVPLNCMGHLAQRIPRGYCLIVSASPSDFIQAIFPHAEVLGLEVAHASLFGLPYPRVVQVPFGPHKARLLRERYPKEFYAQALCYGDSRQDETLGASCRVFARCKNGRIIQRIRSEGRPNG